ncbi:MULTISPECIES: HEPN domain-containing protein [unclassified Ruegeria]|uniref:HEPN domain-containing protein n=1 Tax=unclassified Ruegeria TaxID=2625375 RepID=UPI001487AFBA|nr:MULTISPECIES: HEPN domain-containing protein [unclassified Ruegeria]
MPTKARKLFRDKLLPDVTNLLAAHRTLNPTGRGRRSLGYITRSGVLMLCAAWEVYIEEIIKEGVEHLTNELDTPHTLPNRVKGKLAQAAKKDQHEFGVLNLSGDGWELVLKTHSAELCERLNTPKFGQVTELLHDWLGVDSEALENSWRHDRAHLNEFVTLRGEIAHRGADAQYVRVSTLRAYKEAIDQFVVDTDRFLCGHLQNISGVRPWRNT